MREILTSEKMPKPKFKYSPCVKVGPIYQMAGMIGLNHDGQVVDGGPESETAQILKNMELGLADFGLGWDHLFGVTLLTTKFDKFPEINRAWGAVFNDDNPPPARTAAGVSALPMGATVEIEFRFFKE